MRLNSATRADGADAGRNNNAGITLARLANAALAATTKGAGGTRAKQAT